MTGIIGQYLNTLTRRAFAAYVVVFAAYFIAAKFGLYLYYSFNTSPALIWPPVGIALAAVLLLGYRMWIPIFVAQFFALLWQSGPSVLLISLIIAAGYALQAVVAAYILNRLGFSRALDKTRNMVLIVGAALLATILEPAIATLYQMQQGLLSVPPLLNLGRAWGAGIFSVLVLTPLILTWYPWQRTTYTTRQIGEILAAFGLLALNNIFLFWTNYPQYFGISVIFFLPAVLIWFALRLHTRWLTLAVFLTSVMGVMGTILAHPTAIPLNEQLLSDEIYIGLVAAIFYVFVSVVEERRLAYANMAENNTALQQALKKISRDDKAKTEFLAILAHELRNPLAPIVSALELMKIKMGEERRTDMLEPIEVASRHSYTVSRLLDDILDISRISREEFKLKKEVVSLQEVLRDSIETVDAFYKQRGHTLTVSMPKEQLDVLADPLRLEQIFVNILYNAGKYTNPGGHISLEVVYDPHKGVRVAVSDDGIGIAASKLEEIFEPFTRLSESRFEAGTGLGIGLSLTRKLATLHGAEVWAESDGEGKGSRFITVFPPSAIHKRAASLPTAAPAPTGATKKYSILIVDDNEDAAKSLCLLLQRGGHAVQIAHDGASGLKLMHQNPADVVLLDIGLPDMSGYDVAKLVRQKHGKEPLLVALTGYGQEEDKIKAREIGFNHHLTKPVGIADIQNILAY